MKKVILIFSFIGVVTLNGTFAQDGISIKKGNSFLYAGSNSIDISFADRTKVINLTAMGGYFVANKFAIVGGLGYGWLSFADFSDDTWIFAVGVRSYLVEAKNGGLFLEGLLLLAQTDILRITAGYSLFLNSRVAVEPTLIYGLPFDEDAPNIFSIGANFSIFF